MLIHSILVYALMIYSVFFYLEDLTDPTILREDIDDLRTDLENAKGLMKVKFDSVQDLQDQIDTLTDSVKTLQEQVNELEGGWEDESNNLREKIQQAVADSHSVYNHIRILDDIVLQHHPEHYSDLGLTLNEDEADTSSIVTEETTSDEEAASPVAELV